LVLKELLENLVLMAIVVSQVFLVEMELLDLQV